MWAAWCAAPLRRSSRCGTQNSSRLCMVAPGLPCRVSCLQTQPSEASLPFVVGLQGVAMMQQGSKAALKFLIKDKKLVRWIEGQASLATWPALSACRAMKPDCRPQIRLRAQWLPQAAFMLPSSVPGTSPVRKASWS